MSDTPTVDRVLATSQSKGTARLVLVAIAFHEDQNTALTLDDLVRCANVGTRAVQAAIASLVALGEVRRGKYRLEVAL